MQMKHMRDTQVYFLYAGVIYAYNLRGKVNKLGR